MMKILHIISGLPIGGAEILIETICRKFDKSKYDLYVCSITDEGLLGPKIRAAGANLVALESSIRVYNIMTIIRLCLLMKKIKPDIVQTHIYPANTLGRIAALLANVPVVIATEHGFYRSKKKRQLFLDRLLSHITDRIIVISEAVKTYISSTSRIPADKFHVIYNFIEPENFVPQKSRNSMRQAFGLSDQDFVVGTVGRMVMEKGYDVLLQAVKILKEKGYSFKYLLVGDGKYLEALKSKAREGGMQQDVVFTGFRSDIADMLQLFDIYVLPTWDEGFGISIIEAQAVGIPVVASSVDAVPEIIQHRCNGLLVPAKDSLALAHEIEYLFQNPQVRTNLREEGRQSVLRNFSADAGIKKMEELYDSLIKFRNHRKDRSTSPNNEKAS